MLVCFDPMPPDPEAGWDSEADALSFDVVPSEEAGAPSTLCSPGDRFAFVCRSLRGIISRSETCSWVGDRARFPWDMTEGANFGWRSPEVLMCSKREDEQENSMHLQGSGGADESW